MKNLTLREKIGQTCMPKSDDFERFGGKNALKDYPIGALYLSPDTGIKDRAATAGYLQELNESLKMPLLVSSYEAFEKGPGTIVSDMDVFPSIINVGAAASEEIAYKFGYYQGLQFNAAGINWPFFPVADLDARLSNVMICRCISDDHRLALKMIGSVIRGMQDAGVAACVKHFPSTDDYRDPHITNAKNSSPLEDWMQEQGSVYKAAIDAGVYSVMSAHVSFPDVDSDLTPNGVYVPATMSKKILDGLLRNDLGFEGVVVTDAVNMRGLQASYTMEEIYIGALNTGNDIVLFCDLDYIDIIENAVKTGKVSMARIDEAVERVLALKRKLGLLDENYCAGMTLTAQQMSQCKQALKEICQKSITLINNAGKFLPLSAQNIKKAAIIAIAQYPDYIETLQPLKAALQQRGIKSDIFNGLTSDAYVEEIKSGGEMLKKISDEYDIIIYCPYIGAHRPLGSPFFSGDTVMTLWQCMEYGKEKSIVVSLGSPHVYYEYFETSPVYINAYSLTPEILEAVVEGIFGEIDFVGTSPVRLTP